MEELFHNLRTQTIQHPSSVYRAHLRYHMPAVGHTHAFILLRFFLVFSVDFVKANPEGVLPLQVCTRIDSNNLPYS